MTPSTRSTADISGTSIRNAVVLPWASRDAAAATAAFRVLLSIVPAQQAALEQLYLASLASDPEWSGKWEGIGVGEAAAAAMIAARTNDGRFGSPGFATGTLPGQWRPVLPAFVNDPAAWLRNVKPFLIQSSSQFRSAGPFPLTSAAYAIEFEQVKSVGSLTSLTRTPIRRTRPCTGRRAQHGRGTASCAPCLRRRG